MRIALDFDGTVVTCRERQMLLLQAAARGVALTLDVDAVWRLKRGGVSTTDAMVLLGVVAERAATIMTRWAVEIESLFWLRFDTLIPSALATLQQLSDQGDSVLLLTARARPDLLHQQVAALGLRPYFAGVTVVSPLSARADKARELARWGADVFIGDSESDLGAAVDAGVPFVTVDGGQRDGSLLAGLGCPVVNEVGDAVRMAQRGLGNGRRSGR